MDRDVADDQEIPSRTNASDQLFNVVYDPKFGRFFLEDEALHCERSGIVPPKLVTKPNDQEGVKDTGFPHGEPDSTPTLARENTLTQQLPTPSIVVDNGKKNQATPVPPLDFTSVQQQLNNMASPDNLKTIVDSAATAKQKKMRVQDYTAHFKKTNQPHVLARVLAAGAAGIDELNDDDHDVKWNGEVIHVQVPVLRPGIERTAGRGSYNRDALHTERIHSSEDQWPGSAYELNNLMRIRAHADGLRGVNTACHFVAVSSSESEEDQEQEIPEQHESEVENDLMPMFFRDDRVLFHAKHRWFKGTIRRRIPSSDFYNIRADNGSLFETVIALKIELLDEPTELPYYHYRKGDNVLWVPESTNSSRTTTTSGSRQRRASNNNDDELTYKAKIFQVRSLNRFDVLLRTGRVMKKVSREQLRPREESDFVSATVSRRR